MSPFRSKAQSRAAWSGALGPEMKAKAQQWADETPGGISSLPDRVPGSGHTRYRLRIDRKDSLPRSITTKGGIPNMANKYVGQGTMPKGKPAPKGKRGK